MAENSPEFLNSPILQRINKKKKQVQQHEEEAASSLENSDTKKANKRKTKPKNKETNKIGCEEEQEQETAANRYPPVITRV
jgi:hypothetical protein